MRKGLKQFKTADTKLMTLFVALQLLTDKRSHFIKQKQAAEPVKELTRNMKDFIFFIFYNW